MNPQDYILSNQMSLNESKNLDSNNEERNVKPNDLGKKRTRVNSKP